MKEKCAHCGNMVIGQFSPSDTRKWLTALGKKGGMKAVLTAAGSVIPGFGNVTGFIAGTAIDVIYGKDINKLIDKVADAFDDNKIYVFTCPNCGHTWNRNEDDLMYYQDTEDEEEDDYDEEEDDYDEEEDDYDEEEDDYDEEEDDYDEEEDDYDEEEFDQALSYFLDNSNQVIQSAKTVSYFMHKMNESANNSSSSIGAAFHFLAALAGLFFLKDSVEDEDVNEYRNIIRLAHHQIKRAVSANNTYEYRLIELLLQIQTGSDVNEMPKYVRKAVACKINDDYSWLKKEYYQKSLVPDICFFKVLDMDRNNTICNEDKIALWKPFVNSPVSDYKMYANLQIYWKLSESDEYAYSFLSNAFNTKGFSLNKPNMANGMYQQWLWAAEEYAECLCSGVSNDIGRNKRRGLEMLHTIADLGTQAPCLAARKVLGEWAEKDGNLQQALIYYLKAGEICSDDAMRIRKLISGINDTSNSTAIESKSSDVEDEYLSEFRACMEDGGEISKGERRLLEKLRIKLGIIEERAAELEQSLLTSQLTEEEEEYLAEYKECLAEDGIISAGERRLLNKLRDKLGISEDRARELEK